MMRFLLGLVLGILAVPVAVLIYFHVGHLPVAVADQPFPFEKQIVRVPLQTRIDEEMPKQSPIDASDTNLEAGAHIYRQECAACHGLDGHTSSFAAHMYPDAPQLWATHGHGVVGVSDDPVGETYWKVDNGIRLTGMPAFGKILTPTQMWQVSLLLSRADKPLPAGTLGLLKQPLDLDQGQAPSAASPNGN